MASPILTHVLLTRFPNRDDAKANAIRGADGEVRRTPRFCLLSLMTDSEIYPHGDVWNVELRNAQVESDLIGRLSTLQSLQSLAISRCRLPSGTTANLIPRSTSLRMVFITDTNFGDDQLSGLVECPNLIYLILDGTDITDASIPIIMRCRNLGYIVLRRNKISEAGIAAIRAAFSRSNVVTEEEVAGRRPQGPK